MAVKEEEDGDDETWEMSRVLSICRHTVCWEVRLAMCTVQPPLPRGKLRLPVFGPIQK